MKTHTRFSSDTEADNLYHRYGGSYVYGGYGLGDPCYVSHPPLPLGDGLEVYGGSCIDPQVLDADIYIGLDHSMNYSPRHAPWSAKPTIEYLFPIPDMSVPNDATEFNRMIDWLAIQIRNGKKVHVGCIGGHGRTGMVLAALAWIVAKVPDPITYVRQHYCHKAVETDEQVEFLSILYGMPKAKPKKKKQKHVKVAAFTDHGGDLFSNKAIHPEPAAFCLWGPDAVGLK